MVFKFFFKQCTWLYGEGGRNLISWGSKGFGTVTPVAHRTSRFSPARSKSATALLRQRSIGGTWFSVSKFRTGVALYAPATVRRHRDCWVSRSLAIPRLLVTAGLCQPEAP